MSIELVQSESEFLNLGKDWNSLLQNSASDMPFLRHEFLFSWWETLGGGEWQEGKLSILLHRTGEGKLDGIGPFFQTNGRILFLGSHEIADYLDIISAPDDLPGVIDDFMAYFQNGDLPNWDTIDLYNLREDTPSRALFQQAALRAGFKPKEEIIQPALFLTLPGTWEAYLESLKGRYRKDIEKKLSNAETYFLPISWYIVSDSQQLDQEMDDFLAMMADNPEKKRFLTPEMILQMKSMARKAFQSGWLQLAFLQVGDIKAAGYLNFDYRNQIWVYNSGINNLFENISPGWVLLSYLIRHAIDEGKEILDFMRGDETYKYQFGARDLTVHRLQISK